MLCGEMKEIEDVCVQELGQAEILPHQITSIPDTHPEHFVYIYIYIYIYGCSHSHGYTAHTTHYMSLPVVCDITEQFYAAWHHLAENKSIFNNYDDGEAKQNSLKTICKSLLGVAEKADNVDLSSSQKIP